MAQRLGVTSVHYPYRYPRLPVDVSHERFVLDHNRCILCTRCVRVCAEVEGARVWDVAGRGVRSMIVCDAQPALGRVAKLHQLRQVRPGVPHRRHGRKGVRRGGNGEARRQRAAAGPTPGRPRMKKVRLATVWLDGCSGCHMSLLDMDEAILARGQAGGRGLRPAGGRAGVPQGGGCHGGRRRGQLAGRPGEGPHHPPAQQAGGGAGRLRRHRQRAGHAQPRFRRASCWSASTWRARRRTAAFPPMACRPCCARPCRCTRS